MILSLATAVFVLYMILRAVVLLYRRGGFSSWLWCPKCPKWRRGRAFYGQRKLAWYRAVCLRPTPDFMFDRSQMDIIGLEGPDVNTGLVTIVFEIPEGQYKLSVSPADASGIVSWVGSSPPGL